MGFKYTVQVWGKHYDDEYSYVVFWGGRSFLRALVELMKARSRGYGCVTLECR